MMNYLIYYLKEVSLYFEYCYYQGKFGGNNGISLGIYDRMIFSD